MEPYYPTTARPVDARFASWLSSSPPSTVGYHLRCGMSFPVPAEGKHGTVPGWEARAVAAVVPLGLCTSSPLLYELPLGRGLRLLSQLQAHAVLCGLRGLLCESVGKLADSGVRSVR